MAQSRIERFKEYRNSIIKEGSVTFDESNEQDVPIESEDFDTTSTLPMDEVIKNVSDDEREAVFVSQQKKKKILRIILTVAGLVVLTAGIIIFAILVWKK